MSKEKLDALLGKWLSRKLFTFLWACGLLLSGNLDSETWGMIACIYIGGQTCVDMVKVYRD